MNFPYGNTPLVILLLAVASGIFIAVSDRSRVAERPDLIFATFTKEHANAYRDAIRNFEAENNVRIQVQVVNQRALQSRLQSAMQAGADVPDIVELLDGTIGYFAKGPIEDVGFVDLTERVKAEGLLDRVVKSRFSKWSSRGHVFALPHDVHPIMLAYRKDITDQLGIDVKKLTTWEEFARVGRDVVTKDINGDGIPDRYMLDLPSDGSSALQILVLQRGENIFDANGDVAYDTKAVADVMLWYIHQVTGKNRIAFAAGWGQNLSKAMNDGLVLFYFCPDWRIMQFENDVPGMSGKMALMPMPAWTEGGTRTSTWGGTGLAITKQSKQKEMAWKLAMHLYYDSKMLGERFDKLKILPPLKESWNEPQIDKPVPYFSNQRIGTMYAELASQVPSEQTSAYIWLAVDKMKEAFNNTLLYYESHGDEGIDEYAMSELKRTADQVRSQIKHNQFLKPVDIASEERR